MSAPQTDIEKQKKRHAGPLIGIVACLAFAAILLFAYFTYIATPPVDETEEAEITAPAEDG